MSGVVVKELTIYPIKSCRGLDVEAVNILKQGGASDVKTGIYDRSYALINGKNGWFQSALRQPILFTVAVEICDGELFVRALQKPDMPTHRIPKASELSTLRRVRVWNRWFEALDCGDDIAAWFADVTGDEDIRLVHVTPQLTNWSPSRDSDNADLQCGFTDETVAFHDLSPVNLLSVESLEYISTKLGRTISKYHFRPNILVQGCETKMDEDNWKVVSIGDAIMKFAKRCTRCRRTTISDEGVIDTHKDILNFIKREHNDLVYGGACFSIDLNIQQEGRVRVGDVVKVERRE